MEFSRPISSLEHSDLDGPLKYPMVEDKVHSPQINISRCQILETKPRGTTVNEIEKFSKLQDFASVSSMVYDVAKQDENLVEFDAAHIYSPSIKHSHGFISNPIAESPEYRAYRARQEDKDFYTDKKWPSMLDNFFLDAMIDIPIMGKKKFTYNGKLHGHNQMISLYIWIAYIESLPSNVAPDPSMIRSRKQISSHIQVLKKLLQGNVAFNHIFSEDVPEGSSFDDNPCLIALSQHRLPSKAYREQVRKNVYNKLHQLKGQGLSTSILDLSMKPEAFSLGSSSKSLYGSNMTTTVNAELQSNNLNPDTNDNISFKYFINDGIEVTQMNDENLDWIPNYCEKFPPLIAALQSKTQKKCEIMHLEVSTNFNLLLSSASKDDDVFSQCGLVLSISNFFREGKDLPFSREWYSLSTLTEPRELRGDPKFTNFFLPGFEAKVSQIGSPQLYNSDMIITQVLAPIPAQKFAAMLLSSGSTSCIQYSKYHDGLFDSSDSNTCRPVFRQTSPNDIQKFSVYQELHCKSESSQTGPGFTRLAIMLWSFSHHPSDNGIGNWPVVKWRRIVPSLLSLSPYSMISSPITTSKDNFQQRQQEQFSSEYFFKSSVGSLTAFDSNFSTATYTPKIPPDLGQLEQNLPFQPIFNCSFHEISPLRYQNSNFIQSAYSLLPYHPSNTISHDSSQLHDDTHNDNQNKYYQFMGSHQLKAQPQQTGSERFKQRTESVESINSGTNYDSYLSTEDVCSYPIYSNCNAN